MKQLLTGTEGLLLEEERSTHACTDHLSVVISSPKPLPPSQVPSANSLGEVAVLSASIRPCGLNMKILPTYCGPYLRELAFGNPISVEDDTRRLEAGGLVELDEQLTHHVRQVFDDLLPRSLHPYSSTVTAGVGIHTAYHLTIREAG